MGGKVGEGPTLINLSCSRYLLQHMAHLLLWMVTWHPQSQRLVPAWQCSPWVRLLLTDSVIETLAPKWKLQTPAGVSAAPSRRPCGICHGVVPAFHCSEIRVEFHAAALLVVLFCGKHVFGTVRMTCYLLIWGGFASFRSPSTLPSPTIHMSVLNHH